MHKKLGLILLVLLVTCGKLFAQDFIELWPKGHIPNSKHLKLKDSIANERIYRVMLPGMYAFFPGTQENKGAAVVICPGGGYERLAYVISGFQLAKWFNTMGITAFVLNYRLPNSPDLVERQTGPLMDAQRAIRYIRANATKWGIKPDKIGIMGSSSGGHLAATAGVTDRDVSAIKDSLDNVAFKPDFMILVSPVIDLSTTYAHPGSVKNLLGPNATDDLKKQFSAQLNVNTKAPPCFIVDAINDKTVNPMNSLLFYQALLQAGVPVSFHAFPQGAHAIALRNNPGSTDQWTKLCEAWMIEMNLIPEKLNGK
ncbi:alpha/beta hydrolase [Mucilaginibacter mali]|uniref:Alpha/beta hydrolase n=1 Tax=Mucilaginibacter mali TaxID=2740462 RepID=A0A7D4UM35_9SPHI|nr:alpha/beta hydrolase [Mucilaginibacter mali]QKJ30701.1 alpha/beta hydrolase [Mucilaginibacter mali]